MRKVNIVKVSDMFCISIYTINVYRPYLLVIKICICFYTFWWYLVFFPLFFFTTLLIFLYMKEFELFRTKKINQETFLRKNCSIDLFSCTKPSISYQYKFRINRLHISWHREKPTKLLLKFSRNWQLLSWLFLRASLNHKIEFFIIIFTVNRVLL